LFGRWRKRAERRQKGRIKTMKRTIKSTLNAIEDNTEILRGYFNDISDGSLEATQIVEFAEEILAQIKDDIAKIRTKLG